jgi:hypothetical protein
MPLFGHFIRYGIVLNEILQKIILFIKFTKPGRLELFRLHQTSFNYPSKLFRTPSLGRNLGSTREAYNVMWYRGNIM